ARGTKERISARFSKWIVGSAKRYISFPRLDISLAQRHENGDRSSPNRIVVRGTLPLGHSIRSPDSGCLAVRSIFLLPVREDRHRLVYAVRRDHGFGRSGSHLQAQPFLPA